MPIKPENKKRYPANWKEISLQIRVERAGDRCENCGAINYSFVNKYTRELCLQDEDDAIQIILKVAHLDHTPENCDPENLRAWCQKYHNNYDMPHRIQTRRAERLKGQLQLSI